MSDDVDPDRDGPGLPPTKWPDGEPPGEETPVDGRAGVEAPPVWAEALRLQLLGVLLSIVGGVVALGTTGVVGTVAELVAMIGVAVALFGYYAWPRSASNNS